MEDIKEFVKDRNEAILSLDKEKIINYMEKYELPYDDSNELVFWAGIHQAIQYIDSASKEQKVRSFTWLIINGFSPTIHNQ